MFTIVMAESDMHVDIGSEDEEIVEISRVSGDVIEVEMDIPFGSEKDAKIAYNSLRIDKEPPRGNVSKELKVSQHHLLITMSSKDGKKLRSAVTSLTEYIILVINTLNAFGKPSSIQLENHVS